MVTEVTPEILNILEMVIRCYDCWLSCAAHVTIVDHEGKELYKRRLEVDCG